MQRYKKLLHNLICFFLFLVTFTAIQAYNHKALAVTQAVAIAIRLTEKAEDGDIVVLADNGYGVSANPTDQNIVGVVDFSPPVLISEKDDSTDNNSFLTPVVTSGIALVKVSVSSGNIEKGDFITTSSAKGVGVKSTNEGFVVGKSLESYGTSDSVGLIPVLINIFYNKSSSSDQGFSSSVFGLVQVSAGELIKEPSKALRYLIAATILIASFIFGLSSFGTIARNGLIAIGRNPMASKKIQIGIFFNVLLSALIIGGGIAVAIVILII